MAVIIGIAIWVLAAVLVAFVLVLPVHVVLAVLKEDEWRLTGYARACCHKVAISALV